MKKLLRTLGILEIGAAVLLFPSFRILTPQLPETRKIAWADSDENRDLSESTARLRKAVQADGLKLDATIREAESAKDLPIVVLALGGLACVLLSFHPSLSEKKMPPS